MQKRPNLHLVPTNDVGWVLRHTGEEQYVAVFPFDVLTDHTIQVCSSWVARRLNVVLYVYERKTGRIKTRLDYRKHRWATMTHRKTGSTTQDRSCSG